MVISLIEQMKAAWARKRQLAQILERPLARKEPSGAVVTGSRSPLPAAGGAFGWRNEGARPLADAIYSAQRLAATDRRVGGRTCSGGHLSTPARSAHRTEFTTESTEEPTFDHAKL